jgi:phosphoenolpyruvate synthase/pyruvate phosphate dikinase
MAKWNKIVARNAYPLNWSAEAHVFKEGLVLGKLKWRITRGLIISFGAPLTPLFYPDDFQETNFKELLSDKEAMDAALDEVERIIADDLKLEPGSSAADAEQLYMRHRLNMGLMVMGFMLSHIAHDVLKEKIGAEFEHIEKGVMQPHKKPLLNREHDEIERLKKKGLSGDELRAEAERLAAEYGFVHSEYKGKEWSADDYLRELGQPVSEKGAEVEKLELEGLDENTKWLVGVAQRCTYIFDEAKTSLVRAHWAVRKTLEKIGADEAAVLGCSEEEFISWCGTGKLPADLDERAGYHAMMLWDGEYTEVFGKEAVAQIVEREGITEFQDVGAVSELRGQVAFKGNVRGKVRLCFSQDDANDLIEGEVLVASMTTPELVFGMRKAAAFVTDEGGVTCHAAIVAREMKKPCVIGTQLATKVLKTGDVVEVDAEEGVVRKVD